MLNEFSIKGNCCTVFFACISPSNGEVEGSLQILRTVERAGLIQNSIKRNVTRTKILTPAEGAALRRENKMLKSKIQSLTKNLHNLGRGRIEFNNDSDSGRAKSDSDVKVEAFRLKLRERLMLPSSQFDDCDDFEDSSQNLWSLKEPKFCNDSSLVLGANDSESLCTNISITAVDNDLREKLNDEILAKQKELKHLIALTIEWRANGERILE